MDFSSLKVDMSERKRKLQDPDYEDFAVSLPKRPHLSDEEVRKNTEECVRAIVKKHFATEEKFREEQLAEVQVTLSRAQETLADFRRALVHNAYSRAELLTSASLHQLSGEQTRIHPAVKKLLSWDKKTQSPMVPGSIGLPMTRRAAASLTIPSLSEPSTSKDTPTSYLDPFPPDPSTSSSGPRPSTSKVDDSSLLSTPFTSQPHTSSMEEPLSIRNLSLPSCSRTISPSNIPTETGEGASKSLPVNPEKSSRVPRHLPPSDWKGAAKPCRQMRMIGRALKHLVVGNTSRCLSLESRPGRASHKWMLYVRFRDNQSPGQLVRQVVFKLHPSYAPNDVVKVDQPPFHLYRRGWGEFLARVIVHFRHPRDKPVEITHHLKLDHSGSKVERLGSETHVKVWLHELNSSDDLITSEAESEAEVAESEAEEAESESEEAESEMGETEMETDEAEPAAPKVEEQPISNASSPGAVSIDDEVLSGSFGIRQEMNSPTPTWTEKNEEINIKEELVDVPNSEMGLDIFYDDPASYSEEVVEEAIEEVEIKNEPEEIDWSVAAPIKSEADVPCLEKSLEKPAAEEKATTSGMCIDLSSSSESSSPVPKTLLLLPSLVPNSSLPKGGNVLIKVMQPSGPVYYMQMCQASNVVTPIGTTGQVIRAAGQLGQVTRTMGQVIPNPGQVIRTTGQVISTPGQTIRTTSQLTRPFFAPGQVVRTTGQSVRPVSAFSVANKDKQIAINGHFGTRMVVVARPRLNGAAAPQPAPGRSLLRSVLKPLAIREVNFKQEPTEKITSIEPLMATYPSTEETTQQDSQMFAEMIKREPSVLGPLKRESASNAGCSMTSQPPMGLMAAALQHKNTISRALALCTVERCPSVERMLGTLAAALPLVDSRAVKPAFRCVHPYTAPTLATFFDWPLGKRCAAERLRAVALRRLLLTSDRPPSDIWPIRHIQRWLLLHGFTPVQADPSHQRPARPLRCSYSEPALALAWLDQLTVADDIQPDIDIISVDEHPAEKRYLLDVVEPDNSHLDSLPMSTEMERWSLQLAETTREIGVTLRPEVIAGETLYHAAARVMLEAAQMFIEEILRRSLCKAWERNHNRPPSSLEPRDIRAAVAQHFPLISNRGLGQSPHANQGS